MPTSVQWGCGEVRRGMVERGYEGIMAKDPASPYVEGRSLLWLKVKQCDYRVEERGWATERK